MASPAVCSVSLPGATPLALVIACHFLYSHSLPLWCLDGRCPLSALLDCAGLADALLVPALRDRVLARVGHAARLTVRGMRWTHSQSDRKGGGNDAPGNNGAALSGAGISPGGDLDTEQDRDRILSEVPREKGAARSRAVETELSRASDIARTKRRRWMQRAAQMLGVRKAF